jgi:glutamine amidotransferase
MIAIVDYGIGNLASIHNIIKHVGGSAAVTCEADIIKNAAALIIPGIGHFDACMKGFRASAVFDLVEKRVHIDHVPVLGICVGMQMMARGSEEGTEKGLNWIKADVRRLNPSAGTGLKVPNLGWRCVDAGDNARLFARMDQERRFYFAHSYHVVCDDPCDVAATFDYDGLISAALQRKNILAVQFHPEKSHRFGMRMFENFIKVSGQALQYENDRI